jgi:hypothetical protein
MIVCSSAMRAGLIGVGGMVALSIVPASAVSLVTNGDFSGGNSGFFSDYTSNAPISDHAQYTVVPAANINDLTSNVYGDWGAVTTDPSGGNGNVLIADGGDQFERKGLVPNGVRRAGEHPLYVQLLRR